MKRLFLACLLFCIAFAGCVKDQAKENDLLLGTWLKTGATGNAPADTLVFLKANNLYKLDFKCTTAPMLGIPARVSAEYLLLNNSFSFQNYMTTASGMYTASSFTWIKKGTEFEVKFHQLVFYISADYTVRYTKMN
ncbi:hypothetical protein ESA94_04670 [Lacibacter luteus]|uniref:Lipocalin-like domain-containing protein n=1 Tax=Lacibacter luteus TaxID=2508719 RepID=A0A4Q1CNW1_9BACT|nr:hypothetical protein [Lacibacter luteus]RXK62309.1 hypothetical protein ESA94_04670 [Lacibacter luteus]